MDEKEKRTYKWYRDIIKESGERNDFTGFEYVMLLPDMFYLLCKLMGDDAVSNKSKRILALAIAYAVSPINLIPNLVPGLGLLDDVAVCAYALNKIITDTDKEIINKYWQGSEDLLKIVENVIEKTDNLIGSGLLKRIKKIFS